MNKIKTKELKLYLLLFTFLIFAILTTSCSKKEKNNTNSYKESDNIVIVEQNMENDNPQNNSNFFDNTFNKLLSEKRAFKEGDYAVGIIPKGEYAIIALENGHCYYSEEANGQIIDNENFISFGYVYVHGIGNIKNGGILIELNSFSKTGYKSPKELYEDISGQKNYNFSAHYKIGLDIAPGTYLISSINQGYMSINSGPVGNKEIIQNDLFNGSMSINVKKGQYLELSKANINIK